MKSFIKLYPYVVSLLTILCFILIFVQSVPYLSFIVTFTGLNLYVVQLSLLAAWIPLLFLRSFFYLKLFIITLLLSIVGESLAKTSLNMYRELNNIAHNPFLSYEDKMALTYKGFYPAMKEVAQLTPIDSTIIIPPQANPWEIEGHTGMVTYFLYPRKAINMSLDAKQIPQVEGKLYALIAHGSWERIGATEYGWPKIAVRASNLWHIDIDQNITSQYEGDYDPVQHNWDWGLIEVKKHD